MLVSREDGGTQVVLGPSAERRPDGMPLAVPNCEVRGRFFCRGLWSGAQPFGPALRGGV